jgi:hypothetical protein
VGSNHSHCDTYLAFFHGVSNVIIIPVYERDCYFETRNYRFIPLIPEEDNMFLLTRSDDNDTADDYLVLWSLSPERFGDVSYAVESDGDRYARILAQGYDANGITPCPVVHVTGPCRLLWYRGYGEVRDGILYNDDPPIFEAIFDGKDWIVRPYIEDTVVAA